MRSTLLLLQNAPSGTTRSTKAAEVRQSASLVRAAGNICASGRRRTRLRETPGGSVVFNPSDQRGKTLGANEPHLSGGGGGAADVDPEANP